VSRETGSRPCLVHCNGRTPIDAWGRYILEPSVAWVWPLIDRIRTGPLSDLKDAACLERLLMDLGLHEPVDDDVPVPLLPFSGKGLAIRRRPAEFARFLEWLAGRPPIESYVEIGVGNGGAFIAAVETLRRFHPLGLAIGVSPAAPAVLLDYIARTTHAHHAPGQRAADGLRATTKRRSRADLVLIDAHRSTGDPLADWEYARSRSRYVAFHGIADDESRGGPSLWRGIRSTYPNTYEFVDHRLPVEARAGLGVVDLA
jgi:hypothetical protein